jgi:hypothetical protein
MFRAIPLASALLLSLASTLGCVPEIGDPCNTSLDCSQQGDRLCDTTQPGGYCTIFNCEPDKCPQDEAACVAFDHELDPACKSADDAEWARFQRTFCMKWCDDNSDCRDDYECVKPQDRSAVIIDVEPQDQEKICVTKALLSADPGAGDPIPAVCEPPAGVTLPPPYAPDAGTDGGGGAGGA